MQKRHFFLAAHNVCSFNSAFFFDLFSVEKGQEVGKGQISEREEINKKKKRTKNINTHHLPLLFRFSLTLHLQLPHTFFSVFFSFRFSLRLPFVCSSSSHNTTPPSSQFLLCCIYDLIVTSERFVCMCVCE